MAKMAARCQHAIKLCKITLHATVVFMKLACDSRPHFMQRTPLSLPCLARRRRRRLHLCSPRRRRAAIALRQRRVLLLGVQRCLKLRDLLTERTDDARVVDVCVLVRSEVPRQRRDLVTQRVHLALVAITVLQNARVPVRAA
jgi:hypothetical protein